MSNDQSASFDLDDLVRVAARGDKSAEQQLMGHLSVSFRLFAQHRVWDDQDAEEVVQDALLTITSKYRDIDFEKSFAGWAYKVLNNKILDYIKRKQTRSRLDQQMREAEPVVVHTPNPSFTAKLIDCFRKVHRVNVRHARILNLHYQGFSTTDICHKLGVKENNMYVLLMRARKALASCLGKGETDK